jgi:protocatechuate 3,4-dioxygenase beta subunit
VLIRGIVLRGVVVNALGAPVPGARVEVVGMWREVREDVLTDERGEFEIAGFRSDRPRCSLHVTAEGAWPLVIHSPERIDEPLRIVLDGRARLRVTVTDVAGLPVRDAQVVCATAGRAERRKRPSEVHARTDASGVAALELPPGTEVRPTVSARDFVSCRIATGRQGRVEVHGGRFEGEAEKPLAEGETRVLKVFLRRARTVFGRVTDPSGAAVHGQLVAIVLGNGRVGTATDAAGDYRLQATVPEGSAHLEVRSEPDAAPLVVPIPPWDPDAPSVRVDVRVREAPKRKSGPRLASVRGRVFDGTGEPVVGAAVSAGARPVFTDVTGAFHVAEGAVQDGTRTEPSFVGLQVRAEGFLPISGSGVIRVPANPGDEVVARDIVMTRGYAVEGTVVERDGKPSAGARVWWWTPGGLAEEDGGTTADGNGAFSLYGHPGRHAAVIASAPGRMGRANFDLMLAGARNAVVLRPVVEVRGTVRAPDGEPVGGARVEVVFGAGGASGVLLPARERTDVVTAPDGGFRLFTSAANAEALRVSAQARATKTVVLPVAQPLEVVLDR